MTVSRELRIGITDAQQDVPLKPAKTIWSVHEVHPWYVKYTYPILIHFLKPFVKALWVKEVTGIHHIPKKGPVIIAFNHQSYFDFISFMAVCPRPIHFLSAEKFFSHILWAPFMYLSGQIKVERLSHEKHILHELIHQHLIKGKVIGIFPEGTRSASPTNMLHAFTGVAKYAVYTGVPVIPVGIKGVHEIMSRHDYRPKFKKTISLHIGEPIHFTEHYGKILDEKTYRDLTDRIMLEISRLSGKGYTHIGKIHRDNHR
ncbi:MAG: lysophospholipid acyltransferase family protein [Patescibacteria group bacterium]